jgi:formylglycine-generating enzyme required for sulfatase activity
VEVKGGTFLMGSPDNEEGHNSEEGPQHQVTVSDFYCGKYEVTQRQWKAVMGSLPPGMSGMWSRAKGDDLPVMSVSWDEAKEFIEKLNKLTGGDYRLPSEAEWEYAARAGTTTRYAFGDVFSAEIINNNYRIEKVGSRGAANAFGLFDMHGNAWEWCEDYRHDGYNGAPTDGSAWVGISRWASQRVIRSCSLYYSAVDCRSAARTSKLPGDRDIVVGLRLARIAK